MNTSKTNAGLVGALLIGVALPLQADMASGDYSVPFSTNVNVWDLSGSGTHDLGNVEPDYTFSTDAAGKLAGDAPLDYSDSDAGDLLRAPLFSSGPVRSARNVGR